MALTVDEPDTHGSEIPTIVLGESAEEHDEHLHLGISLADDGETANQRLRVVLADLAEGPWQRTHFRSLRASWHEKATELGELKFGKNGRGVGRHESLALGLQLLAYALNEETPAVRLQAVFDLIHQQQRWTALEMRSQDE
jgi:hypothetical protein